MDYKEAMEKRHSVRQYDPDRALEGETLAAVRETVEEVNRESGLNVQLIVGEPRAFQSFLAHYGRFSGVRNYLAMVGEKGKDTEETVGYYGEKLVLLAQRLGLNTCWVALSYKKIPGVIAVGEDEKIFCVISLGYGANQGKPHRSRSAETVGGVTEGSPDWYREGVEAALLAPTAVNQQKFRFSLEGDRVRAKAGSGTLTRMDLGIAKLHFELGSGKDKDIWA